MSEGIAGRPVTAPEDQGATFVELFFDLVFVFAVTQVTALLREDLTPLGAARAVVVFWLVWWAWTQFSWALNAADTEHPAVRLLTLLAAAVAFFMAQAVPDAFAGGGLWFAAPYVLVRLLGLGLYLWVAADHPDQRVAVRNFALLSLVGLATAVAGGVVPPPWRTALWAVTLVADLTAAVEGRSERGWDLHPGHFAERHGLFVIIALGESLIAAGTATVGADRTGPLVLAAVLAVAGTCALWWTYFGWVKEALEGWVRAAPGPGGSSMARDAYSLWHFPLVAGVVGFAVAVEEAVAHPGEPLPAAARVALGTGVALFVGSMAAAVWRAGRVVLVARLVLLAALPVGLALVPARAGWPLGVVTLVVAAVGVTEALRPPATPGGPGEPASADRAGGRLLGIDG